MKNNSFIFLIFLTLFSGWVVLSVFGKVNVNPTYYFNSFDWILIQPVIIIVFVVIVFSITYWLVKNQ
jgi:hypothetical protein